MSGGTPLPKDYFTACPGHLVLDSIENVNACISLICELSYKLLIDVPNINLFVKDNLPGFLFRSYSLEMIEKINFSHQVYIDQISDLLFPEPILDTYKTILSSEPEMPLDLWKGEKV